MLFLWFQVPPGQFLNRQIYCCIQFAIYGILRDSSHGSQQQHHQPLLHYSVCSVCHEKRGEVRKANCIRIESLQSPKAKTMCRQLVWHSFALSSPPHASSRIFPSLILRGVYNTKINFSSLKTTYNFQL
jgi:hypothetical protein